MRHLSSASNIICGCWIQIEPTTSLDRGRSKKELRKALVHRRNFVLRQPAVHERPVVSVQQEPHERRELMRGSPSEVHASRDVRVLWYPSGVVFRLLEGTLRTAYRESPLAFVRTSVRKINCGSTFPEIAKEYLIHSGYNVIATLRSERKDENGTNGPV